MNTKTSPLDRYLGSVEVAALRATVSHLNAQADAALGAGDVDSYHRIVDEIIAVQDAYMDAHGGSALAALRTE